MESFKRITGIAAPLLRANIDTDQIIPTRFLARMSEEGLGEGLFAEWRVRPDGSPDPDFALNNAPWDRAQILVAGPNFGCGSSREAAPRALRQRGFRAVIAPSFGDIFLNNCFQNGLLPIALPAATVTLLAEAALALGAQLTIDLEAQQILAPGDLRIGFAIAPLRREALLQGLDEFGQTLRRLPEIAAWQQADRAARPWIWLQPR